MTARFGRRFVPALALLLVVALLVMLMPGGVRMSRAAQEASLQGDVNCDAAVNSVDSSRSCARWQAWNDGGLPADAGDVNCDAAVNSVDSLRILRHVAGLSNTTPEGCVPIGEPLAPPPTSEALIAQAPADDNITYEESLPSTAPWPSTTTRPAGRVPQPGSEHARCCGPVWRDRPEEAGLTPALRLTSAPMFRVRPADPASIFNNPPDRTGAVAASVAPTWVSKPVSGAGARVRVKESPDAESQLTKYATEVERSGRNSPAYSRTRNQINRGHPTPAVNPDSAIDFYFVDASDLDPRVPFCGGPPGG